MQSTRQQILDYLSNHPGASAADLGRFLEMTAANIRYHLHILVEEGLIQVSGFRPAGGAGRPISLYDLTSRSLGTNLAPLLKAILESISKKKSADSDFLVIADSLAAEANLDQGNRILRFNQALEYLNRLNYHASWEAHPDGPQVFLRHCPYQDLAKDQDHLCLIDNYLISILFDTPLELSQKRSFSKNPFSPCIFKQKSGIVN